MSNKIVEYKDLIAFHPGQYVEELIEDYNVTQKEFAEQMCIRDRSIIVLISVYFIIIKSAWQLIMRCLVCLT